jgi:hypothetical protein
MLYHGSLTVQLVLELVSARRSPWRYVARHWHIPAGARQEITTAVPSAAPSRVHQE